MLPSRVSAVVVVGLAGSAAVALATLLVPGPAAAAVLTVVACVLAALAAPGALRAPTVAARLIPAALVLFAVGCAAQTAARLAGEQAPVPSVADVGWWGAYALLAAAVVDRVRRTVREWNAELSLDAAIAVLGAASIAVVVADELMTHTGADDAALVANLAFPMVDLVLLVALAGGMALAGASLRGPWLLLVAAVLALAVADLAYLVRVADGVVALGRSPTDAAYPLALALLAAAHLTAADRTVPPAADHGRLPVVPLVTCGLVVVLLFLDHRHQFADGAILLALGVLLLALLRMVHAFRVIVRLQLTEHEARTDELTGLGNRRALRRDLAAVVAEPAAPSTLALFDLDGFKHYNDAFGHPAGDALLARMGARLAAAVEGHGCGYRLGGDEFCVLVTTAEVDHGLVVSTALAALSEEGGDVRVGCSHGSVSLPGEATDADAALGLADVRMYATKELRRPSTRAMTRDVLIGVLREQQPDLEEHSGDVGDLVEAVGRRLGLDADELDHALHAAELHDVGKVAIPLSVLRKPGPLDPDEWAIMRRHTVIGERILAAVPALVPVARLVRASHERWDGTGYPDGLAGQEIPLAARVIAVCDAFHAMTTDRAYRAARPADEAVAELERCAGTQFDPAVVRAFAAELATKDGDLPAAGATASPAARMLAPAGAVAGAAAQELATLSKLRGLLNVSRLGRSGASTEELLAETCRTITSTLGWRTAVANLVLPGDDATEVVAVVGNAEAREALLGTRNELGSWDELLDPRFERQGAYFVRAEEWPTGCTSYVPELRPSADPDGWLPEDALFVPMTGADGVLLGVISVDEPVWGRRPTDDELEVLVAVTGHAALALDAARARAAVVA